MRAAESALAALVRDVVTSIGFSARGSAFTLKAIPPILINESSGARTFVVPTLAVTMPLLIARWIVSAIGSEMIATSSSAFAPIPTGITRKPSGCCLTTSMATARLSSTWICERIGSANIAMPP